MSLEQFTGDADNYAITEHHLRRALQALLDLGRHVAVKSGWGNPGSYREVLELLEKGGVVDPAFRRRIQGMAGYRNRLVHDYALVGPEEIWGLVRERLADLTTFLDKLLAYVAALQ